jgi:hypothetical protein
MTLAENCLVHVCARRTAFSTRSSQHCPLDTAAAQLGNAPTIPPDLMTLCDIYASPSCRVIAEYDDD